MAPWIAVKEDDFSQAAVMIRCFGAPLVRSTLSLVSCYRDVIDRARNRRSRGAGPAGPQKPGPGTADRGNCVLGLWRTRFL